MKVTIEEWTEKANKAFDDYDTLFLQIQKTEEVIIDKIGEIYNAFVRVDARLKELNLRITELESKQQEEYDTTQISS